MSYIDDIIIFTRTKAQHVQVLAQLFQILQEEGIKLSMYKCTFTVAEIAILDHVIEYKEQGISLWAAMKSRREAAILYKFEFKQET